MLGILSIQALTGNRELPAIQQGELNSQSVLRCSAWRGCMTWTHSCAT